MTGSTCPAPRRALYSWLVRGALGLALLAVAISMREPLVAIPALLAALIAFLLTFGAGIFIASVVYGHLAQRSGSILPGMALHFAGDLAYAYFALLGGDSARLFAS